MKEVGILFTGHMVQAILDNRKTLTSRLITPEPPSWCGQWRQNESDPAVWWMDQSGGGREGRETNCRRCRYGPAGRIIWVKETFALVPKSYAGDKVIYRSDGGKKKWPWKPSLLMPHWASRLTLEVVQIWPSQLQDMTEDMAKQEGCFPSRECECLQGFGPYVSTYASLWDSINPKISWASNPWVWRIAFKVIKSNAPI